MAELFTRGRIKILLMLMLLGSPLAALELGIDGGVSSTSLVNDWGVGGHAQLVSSKGLGLDAGLSYYNSISYDAFGTSVTHSYTQYEGSLFWQRGDKGPRLQVMAGGVLSSSWVQMAGTGQDVIEFNQIGYQAGLGLSVPVFSRIRAFAEAGYQGWFSGEMPGHTRWRYGVRLTFGGSGAEKLEEQEQLEAEAEQQRQDELIENPEVIIDTSVPEYIPGHLSQSLPPIIGLAELCKCFPAGPYTLELGEFSNIEQAVRGLEYRGLRQFFNSRSYKQSPLPVFLGQTDNTGPVGMYLGELNSLEQLQYWRHELRKNGLNVRLRKVIGNDGSRVANSIYVVDADEMPKSAKYTAEEITRMNSLPEDWVDIAPSEPSSSELMALENEKEVHEQQVASEQEVITNVSSAKTYLEDTVLQLGPMDMDRLKSAFSSTAFQQILARNDSINLPFEMKMIWDETRKEAWLSFGMFENEQHIDEWEAWFVTEELSAERSSIHYQPMGDVYNFEIGQAISQYSVEIDRSETANQIMETLRSPEVLWFQAFQRINDQPVNIALNWSESDSRYRLIVTNIENLEEQELIWSNLSSVGLLPSLAEQ